MTWPRSASAWEECRGVVVRRARWSESSLVVTWLTDRFGTLRTMARGALRAKSPYSAPLDLFFYGSIGLKISQTSNLHVLTHAEGERFFEPPSYEALATASYLTELASSVAPEMQESSELLDLLLQALEYLQKRPPSLQLLERFERRVATVVGVGGPNSTPLEALASLCGSPPPTRSLALRALENRGAGGRHSF